jgi:hypothetical protein
MSEVTDVNVLDWCKRLCCGVVSCYLQNAAGSVLKLLVLTSDAKIPVTRNRYARMSLDTQIKLQLFSESEI